MKHLFISLLLALFTLPFAFADDHEEEYDHEEDIHLSSRDVAQFLKEHFPDQYQEMRELKEIEPEEFEEAYDEAYNLAHEYVMIKEESPQMAENFLEIEKAYIAIWKTADAAHEEGSSPAELAKRIKPKLNHIFELRHAMGKAELEMLEREVESFREEIESAEAAREEIIEEELQEILAEFDEHQNEDHDDSDEDEEDDEFDGF